MVAIYNIALWKCCGGVFRSNLHSQIFLNYMNELGFEDSDLLVYDAVLSGEWFPKFLQNAENHSESPDVL
jgi:hypothetical protein